MKVACVLTGGPTLTIDGTRFEMHPYCGPVVVNKDGSPKARQPGARSDFWRHIEWWIEGGRRVDGNGCCVYEEPVEPEYVRVLGMWFIVPDGIAPEDHKRAVMADWFPKVRKFRPRRAPVDDAT